ncbi:MAG: DUF4386 domain-containing protein [Pseudonocardia sp.]|nr:DUF4386 domain-containing protein [Pseudonocardia sp.]MDN5855172.1 DUF4386 domain-containing protein [Actinomycetes bacterium]MDN5916303.1 DUF4386 domain-containing protein [Pseudonocardia sp.]MDN5930344.1 DUF4386 domain-containing protein [Pseudonocardia sp.]
MPADTDSGTEHRTTGDNPGARRPGPRRPGRGGPPLPLPIAAYAGLTIAAAVTYPGVMPTDDAPTVLATLQASPVQATVSAVLLVAASAPLAVWTAAATHRLQGLGARVAGPVIGLVGGILAAGSLAVSGLVAWTASMAASLGDPALVRALSTMSFAFGGVGFALGSALLLAGVAVPSLILRLVPRWLAIAGIVVAAVGAASVLSLAVPMLFPLLPVVRFGGLLILIGLSVALPLSRRAPTTA